MTFIVLPIKSSLPLAPSTEAWVYAILLVARFVGQKMNIAPFLSKSVVTNQNKKNSKCKMPISVNMIKEM